MTNSNFGVSKYIFNRNTIMLILYYLCNSWDRETLWPTAPKYIIHYRKKFQHLPPPPPKKSHDESYVQWLVSHPFEC